MTTTPLSVEQARDIADDLIRALEPACGNPVAVDEIARQYVDAHGPHDFALVCMVVVQTTYGECLTPTPINELPPGRFVLAPPTEREAA